MKELYPSAEQAEIFAHYRRCMKEGVAPLLESNFTVTEGITVWLEASGLPAPMRNTASQAKDRP